MTKWKDILMEENQCHDLWKEKQNRSLLGGGLSFTLSGDHLRELLAANSKWFLHFRLNVLKVYTQS